MTPFSRSSLASDRRGNIAFVIVVAAAYILTLAVAPESFALPQGVVLITAGAVYLLFGLSGFAASLETRLLATRIVYFAIQIPLSALIVYLSHGGAWLLPMPLAAHSLALPKRWATIACALIILSMTIASGALSGWKTDSMIQSAVSYLAAVVFVVVFAQITVNEQQARSEVERLAAELSVANRKLREYAAQVEELATTKERNRLAREIHDGLGHYLTAINMQIEAARAVVDTDRTRALDALNKAQSLTKEGLADVRRSVAALRASPLDQQTLRDALARLAEECRAAGIVAEFSVSGTPRPLAPQTELALYRAVEEALTNVRKHAHAARTDIALAYGASHIVRLQVKDNGMGAENIDSGFGLLGVRERVQLLGGNVRISTAPSQGFSLEVEVPG